VNYHAASKRNVSLSFVIMLRFISNKIPSITHHLPGRIFRILKTLIKKEGESGKPKATRVEAERGHNVLTEMMNCRLRKLSKNTTVFVEAG
jgi:hypothetical protein